MRRATLGIPGIEGMNEPRIMISTLAHSNGRKAGVGFRQVVNLVKKVTFTQMGIQIDDHEPPPARTVVNSRFKSSNDRRFFPTLNREILNL